MNRKRAWAKRRLAIRLFPSGDGYSSVLANDTYDECYGWGPTEDAAVRDLHAAWRRYISNQWGLNPRPWHVWLPPEQRVKKPVP